MKYLLSLIALVVLLSAKAEAQVPPQDLFGTPFNCTIVSTATTLTEVTGCGVPSNAGLSRYVTTISWSSSIISSTVNFMLIRSGTGTNCATGTVSHYAGFVDAAFDHAEAIYPIPLKIPAGHAICFIHPGAGTRNVNITGYLAP